MSQPLYRHDLTTPFDGQTDVQHAQFYQEQSVKPTLLSRSEIQQQSVANPHSSSSQDVGLRFVQRSLFIPTSNQKLNLQNRSNIRKPAPSPLQTSTTVIGSPNVTPTRSAFSSRANPSQKTVYNSPPTLEQPKSPKERLDDLLALGRNLSVKAPESGSYSFENKARQGRIEWST